MSTTNREEPDGTGPDKMVAKVTWKGNVYPPAYGKGVMKDKVLPTSPVYSKHGYELV